MNKIKSFALGALLASYAASPAWALDIADVPLFQSTTVSPNIMLLVDNSGSMKNIIQADAAKVGGWASIRYVYKDGGSYYWGVDVNDNNISLSSIEQWGCDSEYKALFDSLGNNKRCYRFPDPVGLELTRYTASYLAYIYATYQVAKNDLTVLSDAEFPKQYRMQVARDSAKSIVSANRSMRIGLSTFNAPDWSNNNGGPGGTIVNNVASLSSSLGVSQSQADTNYSALIASIDSLSPNANTPLAESYYEVSRYFRGMSRYQGSGSGSYTSPIQYRCQKNFGIVVTDGLPTYDRTFTAVDADAGSRLPDWDGSGAGRPIEEQYSDGPGGNDGEGSYLYLDDVAKFLFDIDLRSSGNDASGVSYNDADFNKQNLSTYTVGFSIDNQMLRDAAERGHGEYYTADNAAQLNSVLSGALQSIKNQTSSAAAIATNSTRLDTDTLIYQAKFNSGDWSGELIAYGINPNGTVGTVRWRTGNTLTSTSSRNIYTYTADATMPDGVEFLWANLTPAQQTALSVADPATDGPKVVSWLRGGSSGVTLSDNEVLRTRTTVLGDIVNSDPVFVGAQNYGYTVPNDPLVTTEPADSYQAYLDSKGATTATKLVMVGANDGMLHAFNAETGIEKFAYVPASLFKQRTGTPGDTPGLRYLTKSNYTHKYYVDGSISVGDVYASGWKTYAVGGLGAGGRGIYGLNITSPGSFSASDVLWEITAPDTNDSSNNWNDLGYTYGPPVIARTQDDTWVAIFSNGYDSNTGRAALYVVNASTGALIRRLYAGTETDNGLSAPAVMVDSNRRVTSVFAGDLQGNLWKFDLSSATAANWRVAYETGSGPTRADAPLFKARNAADQVQPITSGLEIGSHPNGGGLIIYFGTGKYFENTDNTVGANPQKQSFYGVWDKPGNSNATNNNGGPITSTDRSLLQQQSITTETSSYRVVSKTVMDWTAKRGWYMDLVPPSGTAAGERAVSLPLLRAGRIIFTTVIPSADPCLAGGTSWLMELDAFTGGNLNYAVLDTNGDGEFNSVDQVACGTATCDPAGMRSREGIIKTPGIVSAGDTEYKYSGGSSGNILVITEKGSSKEGRMSWRQLR